MSGLTEGIWRVADPKITLASVASMVIGAASAAADGPLSIGWLVLTVVGIFFFEAAKNASGEIFDFDSGTDAAVTDADRSPFSGGKRVLVDGLMTRRQTAIVAATFYALGAAVGLLIVWGRAPEVLLFGVVGAALAFFYHAPPLKLSYRGLGEAAVALAYGPLIAAGTYLVQRQTIASRHLWLALPLGLLIAAFLLVNEFPDHDADASVGKRTLVVRLGKRRGATLFAALVATAFVLTVLAPAWGLSPWVGLGLVGFVPAARAAWRLRHAKTTAEIVPAQAWTLIAFLLFALGAAAGTLLG